MASRIPVTDADIVREHRLRHFPGSATNALTNPAMRTCLAVLAGLRKQREQPVSEPLIDNKRRAAGDTES
ncbi:hypothetical protein F3J20_22660 [Paraburkholderia sp. Cy-641]|uniref:hypothetical protein n=1 Tax=Paraburkholderia sp. Cy-641 TaxID=2608337 RepID=UPI001424457E|nr:hypothetical protein [Paraburkholderia sp. Cy-641]NIF80160.1 hypothetical protein [Paraburkholderia sp. Cy-641]